jgi:cysteine desulfurase / selenocysteine lyase
MTPLDVARVRADLPVLSVPVKGHLPAYLDAACTTLTPEPVLRAVADHARNVPGCHGRANHRFGREATAAYGEAREAVRAFTGAARAEDVVFVRNATEAIHLVAAGLPWKAGDVVLTTGLEHNSNLLPWIRLARTRGVRHVVHAVDVARGFDVDAFRRDLEAAGPALRLVAVPHVSNLCGIALPVGEMAGMARRRGAKMLVDGAQAVLAHAPDVAAAGIDFYAMSFHKALGPTGIGALAAGPGALDVLEPALLGGDTVEDVRYDGWVPAAAPARFEAGVGNYDGAAGAKAAAEYVLALGREAVRRHGIDLNRRATEALAPLKRFRLVGPADAEARGSILNFRIEGLDSRRLAGLLDEREGVMVRYGKHCVHAWYHAAGCPDTVRASFGPWNTADEVARFTAAVADVAAMLD